MGDNNNSTHDSAMGWAILGCIFAAVFALFWYFFQDEIRNAVRWFRWVEIWLITLFVSADYTVMYNGKPINLEDSLQAIANIPANRLDKETMIVLSTLAMKPLQYVAMAFIGAIGMWAIMYGPGTQYRRALSLDALLAAQARTFPFIQPFIKFNPAKLPARAPGAPVPVKLPPFAEALSPEEWVVHNQIPVTDKQIDEQAAFVAFARQLGGRWKGPLKLSPYRQVLLAAFCLKASRKRKDSDEMLGRLAGCWSHEKGLQISQDKKLLSDAVKVLRDQKLAQKTIARMNRHAFETTAMLAALANAREEGGVLAPAQFAWMRGHDRILWYPLNNLGRQSFHMEAIGAMAHYKSERMTGRPIPKPRLQGAIQSLRELIASTKARPLPPLEK